MKPRYILAPQAARDLAQIWRYLKKESGQETADRIESVIRSKVAFLGDETVTGGEHSAWQTGRAADSCQTTISPQAAVR